MTKSKKQFMLEGHYDRCTYKQRRDDALKRQRAVSNVRNALLKGVITKQPCAVCGSEEKIEGHHEDYDKQLEVIWLCRKHHLERHAELRSLLGSYKERYMHLVTAIDPV